MLCLNLSFVLSLFITTRVSSFRISASQVAPGGCVARPADGVSAWLTLTPETACAAHCLLLSCWLRLPLRPSSRFSLPFLHCSVSSFVAFANGMEITRCTYYTETARVLLAKFCVPVRRENVPNFSRAVDELMAPSSFLNSPHHSFHEGRWYRDDIYGFTTPGSVRCTPAVIIDLIHSRINVPFSETLSEET